MSESRLSSDSYTSEEIRQIQLERDKRRERVNRAQGYPVRIDNPVQENPKIAREESNYIPRVHPAASEPIGPGVHLSSPRLDTKHTSSLRAIAKAIRSWKR